jgi:hypothetical protein
MGANNYYLKDDIETYQLEEYVKKHEKLTTEYIDKLTYNPQSFEEALLTNLGFL